MTSDIWLCRVSALVFVGLANFIPEMHERAKIICAIVASMLFCTSMIIDAIREALKRIKP